MLVRRWICLLLFPTLLLASTALVLSCQVDMGRDRPDSTAQDLKLVDLVNPDQGKTDTAKLDQGKDLSVDAPVFDQQQPDKQVYKDGPVPDQSPDLGAVLAKGAFSTGGPGSGGNMLLVESGFEVGERLCASTKNICIVGGITP